MRRKFSVFFKLLGALMLLAAIGLFAYNKWDDQRAGSEVAEIQDRLAAIKEDPATAPRFQSEEDEFDDEREMETIEIDGREYIGTLSISRYGLELPILSEWSYEGLRTAPARYTGTTWKNNLVLCGHNYERHFGNLSNLTEEDEIRFTDVRDNVFVYRVVEIATLEPTAVEEMVGREEGKWDLTLFTCTPGGQARVTVRCRLVDEEEGSEHGADMP